MRRLTAGGDRAQDRREKLPGNAVGDARNVGYNIIAPGIGKRGNGSGAYQFLQTPVAPGGYASYVTISSSDMQAMDTAAMASEIGTAASAVNNLTVSNDFFFLPSDIQAAIADLISDLLT